LSRKSFDISENWENIGEKYFNFAIREILIHEIMTRSGPLDPEEHEPSDLGAPKYRHFESRGDVKEVVTRRSQVAEF
jgi:hypothetical protein